MLTQQHLNLGDYHHTDSNDTNAELTTRSPNLPTVIQQGFPPSRPPCLAGQSLDVPQTIDTYESDGGLCFDAVDLSVTDFMVSDE